MEAVSGTIAAVRAVRLPALRAVRAKQRGFGWRFQSRLSVWGLGACYLGGRSPVQGGGGDGAVDDGGGLRVAAPAAAMAAAVAVLAAESARWRRCGSHAGRRGLIADPRLPRRPPRRRSHPRSSAGRAVARDRASLPTVPSRPPPPLLLLHYYYLLLTTQRGARQQHPTASYTHRLRGGGRPSSWPPFAPSFATVRSRR